MMNNVLTIEYANSAIGNLRFDVMTALFRKDFFKEILSKEMSMLARNNEGCISVVYIDIDDFKHINDNYGHYSGDKVIEKTGEILRNNIRASDYGFRIGGDEFALILKNATLREAKIITKKIQAELAKTEFIFSEKKKFKTSISVGIVEQKSHNNVSIDDIIKDVDTRLYEAKKLKNISR